MITSLKLNGMYSIGITNGKIEVNENTLDIKKEIPFLRYALGEITDAKLDYIKSMKEKFSASTHLVEINYAENANIAETVNKVKAVLGGVAVYTYFNITDENMVPGNPELNGIIETIKTLKTTAVDRIMFKDKTTTLDTVTSQNLIKRAAKESGFSINMFGICSSPLSFGDNACLTAIKARELMSKYSSIADVALPSANHQCMNCCGCIRYIEVTEDIAAPPEKEKKVGKPKEPKAPKDSNDHDEQKEAKAKKPAKSKATAIIPGQFNL